MMKELIFIFILILLMGCQPVNKSKVLLILKTQNNPFFIQIEKGVRDSLPEQYHLMVRSGKSESDLTYQLEFLRSVTTNLKEQNIQGVIITPCSSKGELLPYLKKFKEYKIPIVLVDTKIDSVYLSRDGLDEIPYVGSSNYEGGKHAAEFLLNHKIEIKNVLILGGVEGQESAIQREQGFRDVMEKQKDINLVQRTANWSRLEAQNIVSSFISRGTKFDAIFGANDEMALGAIRAFRNFNQTEIPVVIGFDGINEAIIAIKKNEGLSATVVQNPLAMGNFAIKIINDFHKNPHAVKSVYVPTKVLK